MMPVISYLFNATSAGNNMKNAAAGSARILFTCQKTSKKNYVRELIKEETSLTNRRKGRLL
jgi:hypothetical protein